MKVNDVINAADYHAKKFKTYTDYDDGNANAAYDEANDNAIDDGSNSNVVTDNNRFI